MASRQLGDGAGLVAGGWNSDCIGRQQRSAETALQLLRRGTSTSKGRKLPCSTMAKYLPSAFGLGITRSIFATAK
jgi:hypothetical protein